MIKDSNIKDPVNGREKETKNRFIIAGGGTGGHIFPAIAIANALKKSDPDAVILFVGARGKMEMEKVPQAGYDIKGLNIAGFNRSSLIKNIGLPFKLIKSFLQVKKILNDFKPDAVIGVGGYSSYPVLRFAQAKGIKTFLHESNSFAGKSNIWLGKQATKIFTASEGMEGFFPAGRIRVTGNPVRVSITQTAVTRQEGLDFFGLQQNKKTILSVGGSLGAKSLNETIEKNIQAFDQNQLQLIWQTGKPYAERARQVAKDKTNIWTNDFITKMEYALAAADIVISRSGAMAVAELCVMKKPVIFVPYPFAAEDHQTANAMKLVNKNAALMVRDDETNEKLIPAVIDLAKNEERQHELSRNIGLLGISNADELIAKEIVDSLNK